MNKINKLCGEIKNCVNDLENEIDNLYDEYTNLIEVLKVEEKVCEWKDKGSWCKTGCGHQHSVNSPKVIENKCPYCDCMIDILK